jgi:hypothetical protein
MNEKDESEKDESPFSAKSTKQRDLEGNIIPDKKELTLWEQLEWDTYNHIKEKIGNLLEANGYHLIYKEKEILNRLLSLKATTTDADIIIYHDNVVDVAISCKTSGRDRTDGLVHAKSRIESLHPQVLFVWSTCDNGILYQNGHSEFRPSVKTYRQVKENAIQVYSFNPETPFDHVNVHSHTKLIGAIKKHLCLKEENKCLAV